MIERRRRFFRGDSLLNMPIFPGSSKSFQFARVFQSATGIIIFSQVVIAASTDAERLMEYVEGFSAATGQTQIKFHFSIFPASSDLQPVRDNLARMRTVARQTSPISHGVVFGAQRQFFKTCRYCNEQKLELSSLPRISNGKLMSKMQTVMTNDSSHDLTASRMAAILRRSGALFRK